MVNRPSVLIIEPQQGTRTTLEMTLSCERMQVFSATSLGSALLQLRVLQPDLIIIGLDRQELVESAGVAQIKALSSAPLLVLGDGTGALQGSGIADTLPCPYSVGQLCDKVGGMLVKGARPGFNDMGCEQDP